MLTDLVGSYKKEETKGKMSKFECLNHFTPPDFHEQRYRSSYQKANIKSRKEYK